jgi:hypothetical protein
MATCKATSHYPRALVAHVTVAAEKDAAAVAQFLDQLETHVPGGSGSMRGHYPAAFLFGLGFAMRLVAWERQGLFPHIEVGLPSALDAIRQVIEQCKSQPRRRRDELVIDFSRRVFEISCTHFAWEGQGLLGADILVGHPDEDALLDALAEFAWQNRDKVSL